MSVFIKSNSYWSHTSYQNFEVWYYGNLNNYQIKKFLRKLEYDKNGLQINLIKKEIKNFKGKFSVIVKIFDVYFAFVDRIKSAPIFMAKVNNNYQLANNANYLKEVLQDKNINKNSVLSIRMSGYCIGRNTLYKNIKQLLPGEICFIKNRKLLIYKYFNFIKTGKPFKNNKTFLSNKLSKLTLDIFDEIKNKYKDTNIIIPLSAGYDSRLIVSALHKLGVKNVICYSYGKKNNFDAQTAKIIANKLNYKWIFIELNSKTQKKNFQSAIYKRYTRFSDTLSSWSYVQDLFVIKKLISKNIVNSNSVIINGNTGDFISGGHLPDLKKEKKSKSQASLFILEYIIHKHFSLWVDFFKKSEIKKIKKLILESIPYELKKAKLEQIHKIYEYFEFINRQSNYVIQGQRVYDFYNIRWELPLWHDEYLNFWNNVPYELKLNQSLYKFMLLKNNWGGVWHSIPLNKHSISPYYIRIIRDILKLFFLFKGKKSWHAFDKKYISYFTEIVPHYSFFNYFDVIRDKRIARNAVSWHVENYLKLKGLL